MSVVPAFVSEVIFLSIPALSSSTILSSSAATAVAAATTTDAMFVTLSLRTCLVCSSLSRWICCCIRFALALEPEDDGHPPSVEMQIVEPSLVVVIVDSTVRFDWLRVREAFGCQ